MTKKIFILHGWTYDLTKWTPFVNELRKNNIDPILLKIPGLTGKIDRPWTINDYVDWLNSKLESEKEVILLGHSNGGKIAMSYALKYPNKISKIFLIDSSGIYNNDIFISTKRIVFRSLAKIGKYFTNSPFLKKVIYKIAGESDYNSASETMKKTMQNLINVDLASDLSKINTPVVIVWGKKDTVTPIGDAYKFNDLLQNSKLFLIDNARHSPQFTHVSDVAKIIYEHI